MPNPESATRKWSLATLPRQVAARVVAVDERHLEALAAQGVYPGRTLRVLSDAPFGGPRVVQVGAARLAVARPVAAGVSLETDPGPDQGEAA